MHVCVMVALPCGPSREPQTSARTAQEALCVLNYSTCGSDWEFFSHRAPSCVSSMAPKGKLAAQKAEALQLKLRPTVPLTTAVTKETKQYSWTRCEDIDAILQPAWSDMVDENPAIHEQKAKADTHNAESKEDIRTLQVHNEEFTVMSTEKDLRLVILRRADI